jgi:predicted dehydrogenase
MALDLTAEQRALGQANFQRVSEGLTRRGFMKSLAAGAAVLPVSAAAYFGYQKLHGNPVKTALIGTGDEGGVLVGEHNPDYLEIVAVCDIRPTNQKRIFEGEPRGPRKGLKRLYGNNADKTIRLEEDYKNILADKNVEAVIIALPLHLHAKVAIEALEAGKHVLCEKLMAWNVAQCKQMIAAAKRNNRVLSIGHQRHYSMLYAHALEVLQAGVLGEVKHIRALWHRNNSWPLLDAKGRPELDAHTGAPLLRDSWYPPIRKEDVDALQHRLPQFGYKSMDELVRWRLYHRTGGGLMAELGSHQLDACSIFLGKVHPLAVQGFGGKIFYGKERNDRESDDHVFVTYEFPGKNHPRGKNRGNDPDDIVVVTYSSINTNEFEGYGECVMGTRGTLIVETESTVMLYPEKNKSLPAGQLPGPPRGTATTVQETGKGQPVLDTSSTWGPPATGGGTTPAGSGGPAVPPSRGYREEMEDFAFCIRMWDQGMEKDRRLPRCHGVVAMADAIVALTANQAMKHKRRIEFDEAWFDPDRLDAVPDADMKEETL